MKLLSLPRESGVYGVWLASLLFALPNLVEAELYKVLSGLSASILALLTLNYVRYSGGGLRILVVLVVAGLYTPIILDSIPYSLMVAVLAVPLLVLSLKGTLTGIVAGGGLIAFHGSLLYLAGSEGLIAFLPGLYGLFATSQAGVRVGGRRLGVTLFEALSLAGLAGLSAWILVYASRTAGLILLLDIILRVAGEFLGVHSRLPLKAYGFLEFARSSTVMAVTGFMLS